MSCRADQTSDVSRTMQSVNTSEKACWQSQSASACELISRTEHRACWQQLIKKKTAIYCTAFMGYQELPQECLSLLTCRSTRKGAKVSNGFIQGVACKLGLGLLQRHAFCDYHPEVTIIYCPGYAACCCLESLAVKILLMLNAVSQGACCCLHQPAQPVFLR